MPPEVPPRSDVVNDRLRALNRPVPPAGWCGFLPSRPRSMFPVKTGTGIHAVATQASIGGSSAIMRDPGHPGKNDT